MTSGVLARESIGLDQLHGSLGRMSRVSQHLLIRFIEDVLGESHVLGLRKKSMHANQDAVFMSLDVQSLSWQSVPEPW